MNLDSVASLEKHFFRDGQNNPEEVRIVEALPRQTEDRLFADQSFDDLKVSFKAGNAAQVNSHHHVHCSLEENENKKLGIST